ncbi:hypothetical protein BaRGS_00005301, partial [Batillaria attramentaria]
RGERQKSILHQVPVHKESRGRSSSHNASHATKDRELKYPEVTLGHSMSFDLRLGVIPGHSTPDASRN